MRARPPADQNSRYEPTLANWDRSGALMKFGCHDVGCNDGLSTAYVARESRKEPPEHFEPLVELTAVVTRTSVVGREQPAEKAQHGGTQCAHGRPAGQGENVDRVGLLAG